MELRQFATFTGDEVAFKDFFMNKSKSLILLAKVFCVYSQLSAQLITSVPGPMAQGGMVMPMVTITATSGPGTNPTAGTINVNFNHNHSLDPIILRPHQEWQPNTWFASTAAWRPFIGSPTGVGGTPAANAGAGGLYNNRYGFMFMSNGSMMMANVPTGHSLGLRLTSITSPNLKSYNYLNAPNIWDEVWTGGVGSHVLWNGSMWHNYYVMPAGTPPGTYFATYEVFMASTPFTGSTGPAQYDAAALSALQNPNFTTATITYQFTVIPEPGTFVIGALLLVALLVWRKKFFGKHRVRACR